MDALASIFSAIENLSRRIRKLETHEGVTGVGGGGHTIQDEGVALAQRTKLNFVGAGVTASDDAVNDQTDVTIPSASGGHTIQDEGVSLAARSKLNFVGAGVVATDDAGNDQTDVTIPGGGHIIQDEGVALAARSKLNFIGAAVVATDDAVNNKTDVTIDTTIDAYIRGGRAWYWYGSILVSDGRGVYRAQTVGVLEHFYAHFDTAPTGANAIIILKKNGITVATATIVAGADYGETTTFSDSALAVDDELTYSITQIGSTISGAHVIIEVTVRQVISIAPNSVAYVRGGRAWFWYGNLSVATGRGVYVAQTDGVIEKLYANFDTAPTGASVIITLKKNGVTISTLTIPAASDYAVTTTFSDVALAVGDELSYAITQVGSTLPGANMVLEVVTRQTATDIVGAPLSGGYTDFVEQVPVPGSPPADTARLYAKDVAGVTKLCYKDSVGLETVLETVDLAGHIAAADPHTQYQKESEKGSASGYAGLDAASKVPTAQLGGAGADNTKYLRGDQTWVVPAGGGHTIKDEGVALAQRANMDFVGVGVTATDDGGGNRTIVTIPGGGGSVSAVISAASLVYAYSAFR